MPLTWLDIILIGIMFVSGLLAMIRGFTREVLSLLAWVGAFIASMVMYPILKDPVRDKVAPAILADTLVLAGVFILVLVVISVITMRFTDVLLESRVGALDRTLGFIFGVLRGLVLVVIAFLFFAWLVPQTSHPDWVRQARSLPLINGTGDYIKSVLPDELLQQTMENFDQKIAPESDEPSKPEPEPEQPGVIPENTQEGRNEGYRRSERRGLDQLLESSAASQQ